MIHPPPTVAFEDVTLQLATVVTDHRFTARECSCGWSASDFSTSGLPAALRRHLVEQQAHALARVGMLRGQDQQP